MFDHIVFDFDGVISNSLAIACEELNAIAGSHYPTIPRANSRDDLALIYAGPLKTSLRRFGLADAQCADFFDLHSAAMQRRCRSVEPFEDVMKVIASLVPGTCSIVTSSYSHVAIEVLSRSEYYYDGMFQFIRGRELRQSKSRKIEHILQRTGTDARHALHVVDMVSDILYSRTVPISCCAVGWGYHPLSYLKAFDPEFWVATPDELASLLLTNATAPKLLNQRKETLGHEYQH